MKFFKTKKGKYAAYAGLLLLFLTLYFWDEIKLWGESKKIDMNAKGSSNIKEADLDGSMILRKGVNAPEVAKLQTYLNADGEKLAVDGKFGPLTESALEKVKGVKETTLNAYASVSSLGSGSFDAPKVGGSGIAPVTGARPVQQAYIRSN